MDAEDVRVNVDSKALGDPRFKLLGRALGVTWFEALGRCLPVWMACYDKRSANLATDEIDLIAERDGFALAMKDARLCRPTGRQMRIAGVTERIEFLKQQKERSLKGVEARTGRSTTRVTERSTVGLPNGQPYSPDQDHALSPDQDQAPTLDLKEETVVPTEGQILRGITDDFQARFVAAYEGRKPTWNATTQKLLKALLKQHGADEIHRRIAILFDSPPTWLGGPFTVGTLVAQFDRLVVAMVPRKGPIPVRHPNAPTDFFDALDDARDELKKKGGGS